MILKTILSRFFSLFRSVGSILWGTLQRSLWVPLVFSSVVSLLSMAIAATPSKEPEKAQVQTQIASETEVVDTLIYPSTVDSKINATINAEAEGIIKKIWVQVGSSVKAGQALLTYENPDPVYKFSAVTVKAPVSGIVSSIDVSLLSKVEKGQKLLGLTDPRQLKIEIEIPAADLPYLKIGSRGQFRSQLNTEDYVDVKILGLAPLVDAHTGTAKATLEIQPPPMQKSMLIKAKKNSKNNPDFGKEVQVSQLQLHPGMVGQVRFQTNARQRILVPETAVLFRESKTWVRILENGRVKKLLVELGPRHGDSLEIKQGLQNQSEYIVRSSRFLADGDEVIVDNPKPKKNSIEETESHAKPL